MKTTAAVDVFVRWMTRPDIQEVLAIEHGCFVQPWTEEEFLLCLRQRNCIGMVAEHQNNIVGFMIYELLKLQLHVLNLAVDRSLRRRGIGSQMVEKLVGKLSAQRRTEIRVEVRETNLAAQKFFAANGFRATKVLHHFYEDADEDAYVMKYAAQQAVEPVAKPSRFEWRA